jgi:hypothetical protein
LCDGQGAQRNPTDGRQPGVVELICELTHPGQVAEGFVVAADDCLHEASGVGGKRRPERLVLAAKLLHGDQCPPYDRASGAVGVTGDGRGPYRDQLGNSAEVGVLDLVE